MHETIGASALDLGGRRILIAEDEALIALELEDAVHDAGGEVVGPFARLPELLEAIRRGEYDGAILDIMLGDDEVYPAAHVLEAKQVPFVFHSGHGVQNELRESFPDRPLCRKPCDPHELLGQLQEGFGR